MPSVKASCSWSSWSSTFWNCHLQLKNTPWKQNSGEISFYICLALCETSDNFFCELNPINLCNLKVYLVLYFFKALCRHHNKTRASAHYRFIIVALWEVWSSLHLFSSQSFSIWPCPLTQYSLALWMRQKTWSKIVFVPVVEKWGRRLHKHPGSRHTVKCKVTFVILTLLSSEIFDC